MNSGILPFLLMSSSVALALTIAPLRLGLFSAAGFAAAALLIALIAVPDSAEEAILTGFWLSAIVAAALVLVPAKLPASVASIVAINAGLWFGALMTVTEQGLSAALALAVATFFVPARWFRCRGGEIVLKVLSSWIIAVSALATLVSLVPTPGYEPDHME